MAHVYVVEFQKRGLPHAHILVVLKHKDKPKTPDVIDRLTRAEIPDVNSYPRLNQIVLKNMIHGPCGADNPKCCCMADNVCTKNFPKEFRDSTENTANDYANLKRSNTGIHKKGIYF